jgi:MinD-like ATPase involved in chromosome partitioning or flagellar assembly
MTAPSERAKKPGRIYTFYSYKGGTGRSMTLANVAWIMASAGRRVLTIDWDLEAPGLHRYYHPFLRDPEAIASEGLIDFLLEFVSAAHQGNETSDPKWYEPYANILPFAVPVAWEFADGGALHMVSAGRQDGGYATRVTSFDWVSFYKQLGGGVFLEAVKTKLRDEYDYVLIDSRTGLSDTSGICSVQMPDEMVCCFTLNSQSINGASGVAESAFAQRLKPNGEPGLRIWPVATRVEMSEREKLENAREMALLKFSKFISHLPRAQKSSYMPSVEVLYQPYFAYEEILATIADRRHQTGSLLGSFENITRWITDGDVNGLADAPSPQGELKRKEALDKFTRRGSAVKAKVYVAVHVDERMASWLTDGYLHTFSAVTKRIPVILSDDLQDMSQLLTHLGRAFGPENVLMRRTAAPLFSKGMRVQVTSGTAVEADVILFPIQTKPKHVPEVKWALENGMRAFPFLFSNTEWDQKIPPEWLKLGCFPLARDQFDSTFLELRGAIEEAARDPKRRRSVANPDDPQKGRWGGSASQSGRTLSAEVSKVSDDWFNVVLKVTGHELKGDVTFYLHPTFQPNTLTVKPDDGVAKLEMQSFGAFTVGAVADQGSTFLELDLAEDRKFPQTFRER